MAQQQVNVGAAANDGTGDLLRTAFQTFNANATDAETRLTSVEPVLGYHTVTLTPEISGSITVNTSSDQMRYRKIGTEVFVKGQINTSSSSSPVGTYIEMSLPFPIADLDDQGGRIGGMISYSPRS